MEPHGAAAGGWQAHAAPLTPEQARIGAAQQGFNPFAATMAPDMQGQHYGAPQPHGGPPPGQPGHAPPGYGPPPGAPPPGYGPPPGHQPLPPEAAEAAAYAATAPPPTREEFDAMRQHGGPPAVHAQPAQASPPPPAELYQPPPGVGAADPQGRTAPQPSVPPQASDAKRVLVGFLVSFESDECGKFWPLYQGPNQIGRIEAAEGLDIEIDHPTTSSRHATLHASAKPGRVWIEDLGSTNGTFVGDARLQARARHELRDGEGVRFGGYPTIVKVLT